MKSNNAPVENIGPTEKILTSVLVLGHAVKHLFVAGFFIILTEIQIHFGLSHAGVGMISTIRNAGSGLGNLSAGYMADRFNNRWKEMLSVSIILVGIFHFFIGWGNSYTLLLINTTIAGIAISFWHPPAIAALAERFPQRRGFAISLHGTGGSIGEALGPFLVGTLLTVFLWRTVLQIGVIPAFMMGVITWITLKNLQGNNQFDLSFMGYLRSLWQMLRIRGLITTLIVTAGFSSSQGIIMTFLPIYLKNDLGFPILITAAFVSGSQVVGIGAQPFLGYLSDKYSRKSVLVPSLAILGLLTIAIPFAGSVPLLLIVTVLLMGSVSYSLMSILLAAGIDQAQSNMPATTISLVFSSGVIFSAVSPYLAGLLADSTNLSYAFFLAGAIAIALSAFTSTLKWGKISNK
ncbi:MAG: MFS family permease [Chloroflexi bacterium]|jgi:MFS family permease|nr:MAG: MFS family permease [Chloroflexota bacterium]